MLYADNPGEDVASASQAVEAVEAEAVASEEQVVSEASVSTGSSSEEGVQELGRVAVTGSRIKRVDVEGATPLITITRSDIEAQGLPNCI